jgi:peptide-methionine (S)-S-oxide reductase
LLRVFFATAHDPTQLNRQGNDVGTQYRSAIFYANEDEKRVAEAYIAQLNAAKVFPRPIVTTLEPLREFFVAEAYHQDFAARNPNQGYIRAVSMPKVEKTRKAFADKLRTAPAK